MASRRSSPVPHRPGAGRSSPKKGAAVEAAQANGLTRRKTAPKTGHLARTRVSGRRAVQEWILAIALCLLALSGLIQLGRVGLQLIVNPQSLIWVNRWIPGWISLPLAEAAPKALHTIREELRATGKQVGEPISLGKGVSFLDGKSPATDLLLPVLEPQPNCQTDCDRIVELRVYQTSPGNVTSAGETAYFLVSQLPVKGPEESFVVAPLVDAHSDNQGSSHALSLSQLKRFEGKVPGQGVWLNLSGRRQWGNDAIAYGQIIFYYPQRQHLATKLQWSSPTGADPVWKQVTGNSTPELIVNQTLGLEPQFQIYQVKPLKFVASPLQLAEVSLADPLLNHLDYSKAMLLARNGLWSPSLEILQRLKQQLPKQQWSEAVQAQMDLIRRHAQVAKGQAEGSWASPGQQVMANLIDGRWQIALQAFQDSAAASQETAAILRGDTGRLAKRIKTALQLNPAETDLISWNSLLIAAQNNPNPAIAWLKKEKVAPKDRLAITTLIQRLDSSSSTPTD